MKAVATKAPGADAAADAAKAITLIEAITQALAWEMQHDDSVVVLG